MIARIWHGAVPVEKSEAYLEKMRTVALPGYRDVEGNQGAWVMHRIEGDIAHFDMLSFWDDVDAIKRFAGEDYNISYYFEFDDDFLIEKEPHVRHCEMFAGSDMYRSKSPCDPHTYRLGFAPKPLCKFHHVKNGGA